MSLQSVLLVFLGGGLGSVFRYLMGIWISSEKYVYISTLIVNVIASLFIGIFIQRISLTQSNGWTYFLLITGFCGGLSTFSSFSNENFILLQQGRYLELLTYVILSVLLCLLAVFIGYKMI